MSERRPTFEERMRAAGLREDLFPGRLGAAPSPQRQIAAVLGASQSQIQRDLDPNGSDEPAVNLADVWGRGDDPTIDGLRPTPESMACSAFERHRSEHKWTGIGWVCTACAVAPVPGGVS